MLHLTLVTVRSCALNGEVYKIIAFHSTASSFLVSFLQLAHPSTTRNISTENTWRTTGPLGKSSIYVHSRLNNYVQCSLQIPELNLIIIFIIQEYMLCVCVVLCTSAYVHVCMRENIKGHYVVNLEANTNGLVFYTILTFEIGHGIL